LANIFSDDLSDVDVTVQATHNMSFPILFKSYKTLLLQRDFEDSKQSDNALGSASSPSLAASDLQGATKKIFAIAVQQNTETLNKLEFYDSLRPHFISLAPSAASASSDDAKADVAAPRDRHCALSAEPHSPSSSPSPSSFSCTPLLREIGWDLLTELFLLFTKDARFSHFVHAICADASPRELSIMFAEVFSHPMLSVAATHHHFQLHAMRNHYVSHEDHVTAPDPVVNMDASDDILSFHRHTNYLRTQTLFVQSIVTLFRRLTAGRATTAEMNHFYGSLLPTAMLHFETLSKELSYQFYLHNATQYHSHHQHDGATPSTPRSLQKGRSQRLSFDAVDALDATKKERQEWLVAAKKDYERYTLSIYTLFAMMVDHHTAHRADAQKKAKGGAAQQLPHSVDVERLTQCFQKRDAGASSLSSSSEDEEEASVLALSSASSLNTLWVFRVGLGVLSGVYWWYNVVFSEDIESDGDVNNDSAEIQRNLRAPSCNVFMCSMVDTLKEKVVVPMVSTLGIGGNVLFGIRGYVDGLENELEDPEKPWHLSSDQLAQLSKSNPTTPTPQLQPMSSFGPPDLNTIVEEQEDSPPLSTGLDAMEDIEEIMNGPEMTDEADAAKAVHSASISPQTTEPKVAATDSLLVEVPSDGEQWAEGDGWDDDDAVEPSSCHRVQATQALVDELKQWAEYVPLFGVSCYYHSLWVLLRSDDCSKDGGALFARHSKHIWKCIQLLFEQPTTLPAGIEFGEFVLNLTAGKMATDDLVVRSRKDLDRLLSTRQFHESGLWQLVQHLTSQLKSISDRALHQKLWQFVVHVINAADLKTRFQCIVSTALQCPIPVVQSLMFTELKNQIFKNWNVDLRAEANGAVAVPSASGSGSGSADGDGSGSAADGVGGAVGDAEDDLNPFCSRQVVMVLVQRLGKELQNVSLQNIYQGLDSLNASLNLCRFILTKDRESNLTQIYDADCPLKHVIRSLCLEMTKIADEDGKRREERDDEAKGDGAGGGDAALQIATADLEDFQRQMMKNQFLVSLDLVKRIMEIYKLAT